MRLVEIVSVKNQNPPDNPRLSTIVGAREEWLHLPREALLNISKTGVERSSVTFVCLHTDATAAFPY